MNRGGRREGAGRKPAGREKRVRVDIYIEPSELAAARALAAGLGISVSAWTRQLILNALEPQSETPDP